MSPINNQPHPRASLRLRQVAGRKVQAARRQARAERERIEREQSAALKREQAERRREKKRTKADGQRRKELMATAVSRAVEHARADLERSESWQLERKARTERIRPTSPAFLTACFVAILSVVAPVATWIYFSYHPLPRDLAFLFALGLLIGSTISFGIVMIIWTIFLSPWLSKKSDLADISEKLAEIADRKRRLNAGDYKVCRNTHPFRADDDPYRISFDRHAR